MMGIASGGNMDFTTAGTMGSILGNKAGLSLGTSWKATMDGRLDETKEAAMEQTKGFTLAA